MPGRTGFVGALLSALVVLLIAAGPAVAAPIKAGAAVVDGSWHVGASAGQYASDGAAIDPGAGTYDPTGHSTRRSPSYGIQSRLSIRALVVEGPDPDDASVLNRVAIIKNDLYIPQDLLWRRTAQILEDRDVRRSLGLLPGAPTGIGRTNLTMAVSHSHSSPYYSTPSWGVWAFQDVFDIRFFEYYAQRQALAVEKAAAALVPVRMGASVSQFDKTHRHSFGPAIADDGTPAGYPVSDANHDMMIARFDEILPTGGTRPLAILMNFALHPEFLDGNDIVTGEYIAPLERMVDRATGATLIFTQGDVGTAEPERSTYHSVHERLEFTHREYAQAEFGARLMADSVLDTWSDVASGTPETPGRFVPFQEGFSVKMFDRFFPGPNSHPYPGVSSCRTDRALGGNPQAPLVGLPDCAGPGTSFQDLPFDPGLDTDDFEAAGIPIPENYSALSYTGLEEDLGVHLQAIKLGDFLITVCSCEQWKDQGKNIQTRTDRMVDNEYLGFAWWNGYSYPGDQTYAPCTQNADTTWKCPSPRNAALSLPPITDHEFRRMKAQVQNPANGWNDLGNVLWAESEPVDTSKIWGNFSLGELPAFGKGSGYGLTMTISMANDYNGYLASYREYSRGDHYRKALTGWGPHSQDYFATRMVQAGGWLNGGPAVPAEPLDAKETADLAHNDARAKALGEIGATYLAALEAALPADGGPSVVTRQPAGEIKRFGAAFFSWIGGSNFTDDPFVKVQRRVGDSWTDFADMSGEVVATLDFPTLPDDVPAFLTGDLKYEWTATYEVFDSKIADLGGVGDTPLGEYRFVVDGLRRDATCAAPTVSVCAYHHESDPFQVVPWNGITVPSISVDATGDVVFSVGPTTTRVVPKVGGGSVEALIGPIDYPDSYAGGAAFIRQEYKLSRDPGQPNNQALFEWYCDECAFRPWDDTGKVVTALATVKRGDGSSKTIVATLGGDGLWHSDTNLVAGESALVASGGIIDEHGETNAVASSVVTA